MNKRKENPPQIYLKKMKPNYSIIIPHKDIPDLLQRCLDSIPVRDDVEVIVRKQRDGRLGVANMKFYKQFSMMTPDDQGFGGRYEDKNFAVPV